jgi:hypothetical protein
MRVEFIAYAGDCRVAGATTLGDGERLTDVLNRDLTIVVEGARLTSHADGHTVEVGEIALDRDDLFAIEAIGPRGSRRAGSTRSGTAWRCGSGRTRSSARCTRGRVGGPWWPSGRDHAWFL